jgi:hypothetical protein
VSYITPVELAIWRFICQRDMEETAELQRQQASPSPAAHFMDRLADDYIAQDELAEFGLKLEGKK